MSGYTHKIMLVNNMINPITGQGFNSGLGYHPHRMEGGDITNMTDEELLEYINKMAEEEGLPISNQKMEPMTEPEVVKSLWNEGRVTLERLKTLYIIALGTNPKLKSFNNLSGSNHENLFKNIFSAIISTDIFNYKNNNTCMYELMLEQYKKYINENDEDIKIKYARKIYILYSILRDYILKTNTDYNSVNINAGMTVFTELYKQETITQHGKTAGTVKPRGALYKYDEIMSDGKNNYAKFIIMGLIYPFFGAGDASSSKPRNIWFTIDENNYKNNIKYTPDITDTTNPLISAVSTKELKLTNKEYFKKHKTALNDIEPTENLTNAQILRDKLFEYSNINYFKNEITEKYKNFYVKDTNIKNLQHNEDVRTGKKKYKLQSAMAERPTNINIENMLSYMVPEGGGVKLEFNICGIDNPFAKAIFKLKNPHIRMTSLELFSLHLEHNPDAKTLNIGGQYSMDCIDIDNKLIIECKDYSDINHIDRINFNLLIKTLWLETFSTVDREVYNKLSDQNKELEFYRNNLYFGIAITTNKFMHIDKDKDISNTAPVFYKIENNKPITHITTTEDVDFIKKYIIRVQGQKTKPIFNNQGRITSIVETGKTMPYYKEFIEDVWFKNAEYTYYILVSTNKGLILYDYSEDARKYVKDNKIWNYYRLGKQTQGKHIGAVIIPMDKFKIVDAEVDLTQITGTGIETDESLNIPVNKFEKFMNEMNKSSNDEDKQENDINKENDKDVINFIKSRYSSGLKKLGITV